MGEDGDTGVPTVAGSPSSPYSSGGGGVSFERRVAVRCLGLLLTGAAAPELGSRRLVRVALQQAPAFPVDDIVLTARSDPAEADLGLVLSVGVRREPSFVSSHVDTAKLVREFVRAVLTPGTGPEERRLCLVVDGVQAHATEVGQLAEVAAGQATAKGFVSLVGAPGRYSRSVRRRLEHLTDLVGAALPSVEFSRDEVGPEGTGRVNEVTWTLLSSLTVLPLDLGDTGRDWATVLEGLRGVARGGGLSDARALRDRLESVVAQLAPVAADVDAALLSGRVGDLLGPAVPPPVVAGVAGRGPVTPVLGPVRWSPGPLVGRDRLVDDVRERLAAPGSRLTLVGPSGVGKSRLAAEVASRVDLVEGVTHRWWCDGSTSATFAGALAGLAEAAHESGLLVDAPAADATAAVWVAAGQRLVSDRDDLLLVVDNVGAAGLAAAVPGHVRARLLATSVAAPAGPQHLNVPALSRMDVVALLAELGPGLDRAGLPAVADAVGGLPLAAAQAAGTMASTG